MCHTGIWITTSITMKFPISLKFLLWVSVSQKLFWKSPVLLSAWINLLFSPKKHKPCPSFELQCNWCTFKCFLYFSTCRITTSWRWTVSVQALSLGCILVYVLASHCMIYLFNTSITHNTIKMSCRKILYRKRTRLQIVPQWLNLSCEAVTKLPGKNAHCASRPLCSQIFFCDFP